MNGSWILSGILALPLIGALFIVLLPGESEATKRIRAVLPGWVRRAGRDPWGRDGGSRGGGLGQIWVIQSEKSRAPGNTL